VLRSCCCNAGAGSAANGAIFVILHNICHWKEVRVSAASFSCQGAGAAVFYEAGAMKLSDFSNRGFRKKFKYDTFISVVNLC
jgi:hypothetical protein